MAEKKVPTGALQALKAELKEKKFRRLYFFHGEETFLLHYYLEQIKKNLIDELAKINRVISRELPDATRDTLLVLDASTGQNALVQAKEFRKAAEITGLVLTKLDGTAKGGIVLAIKRELGIPVKFIGVGEGIDDLQRFNGNEFIEAFFEG